MAGYKGPLFRSVFIEHKPPKHAELADLIFWGKIFSDMELAPSYGEGSHGNLSIRRHDGCIITATKTDLKNLSEEQFVEIIDCQKRGKEMVVFCKGTREPSTDSFIHYFLYQKRHDVNAILHGHDMIVLEKAAKLRLPQTREEKESGSIAMLKEVEKTAAKHSYLVVKNHGILSFGRNAREAGERALEVHERALSTK